MTPVHKKILGSLFWKILEQTGYQGVQLVVSLVLARILGPEEYGLVSLIMIFITLANTFVQSGFATALVQNKDVEAEDYSSVFWLSLLLSGLCYGLLFAAAPWIAAWYREPLLSELLRLMALVLFPGAVISVQTARAARAMEFRRLFYGTMLAVIFSGGIAIFLSIRGFGVFALAAQQLLYYFSLMAALFFFVRWRPLMLFRMERVRALFSFGWKILVSGLIDTLWQNIYGLVIGKKYSGAELGVYSRGEQFPKLLAGNLTAAFQSVMLPAFSGIQEDKAALKPMFRRSLRLSSFLFFPMMAGMFAVSKPMVILLLTGKWLAAVPYLRIMCAVYAILPLHALNLQLMNALGRSDLFLKLEILKKLLGAAILLISLRYGIMTMLLLRLLDEYLCLLLNAWPNRRLIGLGPWEQLRDMLPPAACSILMALAVFALEGTGLSPLPLLMLDLAAGIASYILFSFLLNREILLYAVSIIRKILHVS